MNNRGRCKNKEKENKKKVLLLKSPEVLWQILQRASTSLIPWERKNVNKLHPPITIKNTNSEQSEQLFLKSLLNVLSSMSSHVPLYDIVYIQIYNFKLNV